jgi:hypothetical protein
VLKSGCGIKKLQERSIEKSTVLIQMYSIIAVMILNMTCAAWLTPELPSDLWSEFPAFGGRGVETAVLCGEQGEKRTEEAIHDKRSGGNLVSEDYQGRLGGPKRAPSDEPPGVKTIWIGLMKVIYSVGLPGVPHVNLWVKFSLQGGVSDFSSKNLSFERKLRTFGADYTIPREVSERVPGFNQSFGPAIGRRIYAPLYSGAFE